MLLTRVIPCLLLDNGALIKTIRFDERLYVGDPANAVRIFSEKEVDELVVLDISATAGQRPPDYALIERLAGECFMPLAYGGGITSVRDAETIFRLGVEKVILNTAAIEKADLVRELAGRFGSQAVVVAVDARRAQDGSYHAYIRNGKVPTGFTPAALAERMCAEGAGEIFINSIDNDGTMEGYDLELIKQVTQAVSVPVIACGGAGKISDFGAAVNKAGATAVAAGSMVVFFGRNRAVLINFPNRKQLEKALMNG